MADPGFPEEGGANLVKGRQLLMPLHFVNICMSKRKNWDHGGRMLGAPPLDPPLNKCEVRKIFTSIQEQGVSLFESVPQFE